MIYCAQLQNTYKSNVIPYLTMGFHKSTLAARGVIRNYTLVVYQRLQRLTWICLHVLLNACLNHPQLAIYRAGA